MKKILLGLSLAFFITHHVTAQKTDLPTTPPSYWEQETKTDIFRGEAERVNDLVHTKIDIKFDFEKSQAPAEAWVTLKPHFYETSTVTLDAKAFLIHEVALVSGKSKKTLKYDYNNEQLKIALDKAYKKGEEYTLYIKYTARPEEVTQEGSSAISDAKGLYFINPKGEEPNKPTQIWTQGETESSSCWFPTIDKPNQKTSQETYITVPDKYITLSNGLLKKQTKNSDGTRTDYWNFDKKHAPYLFFMGIGEYAVIKDKWKDIVVDYYVEKEYEPYARGIFGDTPDMIQFFSELLNYEFPWQKYSQIVGRDYVSGAMENTTAVIFFERVNQKTGDLIDENTAEPIVAHELFHHWFGDLVTAESWGHLTVNESFANYSEYLWYEHKYGKDRAEAYRLDDLDGYKMGENFDKHLTRYHYNSREDMFDGVSYNKGGMGVLHMLRKFLGDEAFFAGLSKYLKDNEYQKGETVQLRLALEEVSGRDLNWFFNQWWFGNGHPKLNVTYKYDEAKKKVRVDIAQTQKEPLFEFPIAFDVVVNGKTTRHHVWAAKKEENTFEFDAASKPDVVIPNADYVLLSEIADNKSTEEYIEQYKAGKDTYGARYYALEALYNAQSTNPKALETIITSLNDPYYGIRINSIEKLDIISPDVKSKAVPVLKKLARSDEKTLVRAAALTALLKAGEKDDALFQEALKSESYKVQAAALSYIAKNNPEKIAEYTKNIDNKVYSKSDELLKVMLPKWIAENDLSKAELIAESAAFYVFVKYQDPELGNLYEKGFNWIMSNDTPAATTKMISQYKQAYGYLKEANPFAANLIKTTIEEGITKKKAAFEQTKNQNIAKQIEQLQTTLDGLK